MSFQRDELTNDITFCIIWTFCVSFLMSSMDIDRGVDVIERRLTCCLVTLSCEFLLGVEITQH